MHRLVPLLVVAILGCSEDSQPEPEPTPGRTTALVLTTKNAADASTGFAVSSRLAELAEPTPDHETLWGPALEDRLGEPPGAAVSACGANLTCIAELGRKAQADEVLFGRLAPVKAGLKVQILVLDTKTEKLTRRVQLEIASLLDLDETLVDNFEQLLGVPLTAAPAPADVEEPELEILEVIAKCGPTRGAVRIRPAATLTWMPLRQGRALHAGDQIETGAASTARVEYTSGSSLEIAPRSVVVIEESGTGDGASERLAIQSGTVRGVVAEGQRDVEVRAPDGEKINLMPEIGTGKLAYRVGVRGDQALEVAVNEGRAVVTSGDAKTTLAAGRAQDIKRGKLVGKVVKLPDFPRLVSPGVDATVMFSEGLRLKLVWKAVAVATSYHVQVADDQSFRELRVDEYVGTTDWFFDVPRAGTYYWRVATEARGGRESEYGFSRRAYVTPEKIPDLLVSPGDGAVLQFEANKPRFINFAWRAAVPPAPYVLLVSEYEDIRHQPVVAINTKAQKVMTRQVPAGYYYWGVYVVRNGKRKPIFKNPRKLTVEQPQ